MSSTLKICVILSITAATTFLTPNLAGAQQYRGAGSVNQYGGSQNQYRLQQMQAEAERQRRNQARLEEIRRNNQARQQQQGRIEVARQQYRYRSPYGPY